MQFTTDENNPDWRSRIDKRFTSLRGYAALTVMLAHYQYIGFLPGVPVFKYSAQCGLMLFFFLSSFLLCHSLASDPNWTARPHLSLMTYSINRIFRIFPSLAVIIALTYWNRSSFFSSSIPYLEALRLSMTLGKAPSVLWTIPVELMFYVYLPIVLALTLPATRSRFCAAALASAYLAWCAAIAFARHNGVSASLWMTLGFHHYANSFVGGVLFYALLANGRIRFPQSAALAAWVAPLMFVLAYPFLYFAIIRRDYSMAELAAPGAWQSYYDVVFPVAPLVVGAIVYGLLHPAESLLSRVMRIGLLHRIRRSELRRLPRPHSDDRFVRVQVWIWRSAVLRLDRGDFRSGGRAFSSHREARHRLRAGTWALGSRSRQGQARRPIAATGG